MVDTWFKAYFVDLLWWWWYCCWCFFSVIFFWFVAARLPYLQSSRFSILSFFREYIHKYVCRSARQVSSLSLTVSSQSFALFRKKDEEKKLFQLLIFAFCFDFWLEKKMCDFLGIRRLIHDGCEVKTESINKSFIHSIHTN